ncbi:hypothetical protein C9413_30290 [Rhizobium sp. SEMIA 4085]|uniref:hypothetical protein n=1 Tax=Rhizobium TaxID=379 RepID=UPI001478DDA9|nr:MULTISPECIES: hypothetical protein [Rhizobium]NNH33528.1 hypothetical protein [Rhizobium sp. SEMIA 4085]
MTDTILHPSAVSGKLQGGSPTNSGEAPAASGGEVSHRCKTQTAIKEADEPKRNYVTQRR